MTPGEMLAFAIVAKTCSRCVTEKPATTAYFVRRAASRDGLHGWCKDCMRAYRQGHPVRPCARSPESRERMRVRHREYQLERRYGLIAARYEEMVHEQDNRCAICERDMSGGVGRHVDHDHATGMVRGLLCVRCNTTLGRIEAIGLDRITTYLEARL